MCADRPRRPDGPLRIAALLLGALGGLQLAFGVLAAPWMVLSSGAPELASWLQVGRGGLIGLGFLGASTLLGVASIVAAAGLHMDRIWAWQLGIAMGALYVPTGCFWVGLPLLFALLEPGARAYFLWKPDQLDNDGLDCGV